MVREAIAGIGFITPIFMILNGVSVGLGSGATSSISRFIGAKNHEKASQSAAHSLLIFSSFHSFNNCIIDYSEPLLKLYGQVASH